MSHSSPQPPVHFTYCVGDTFNTNDVGSGLERGQTVRVLQHAPNASGNTEMGAPLIQVDTLHTPGAGMYRVFYRRQDCPYYETRKEDAIRKSTCLCLAVHPKNLKHLVGPR